MSNKKLVVSAHTDAKHNVQSRFVSIESARNTPHCFFLRSFSAFFSLVEHGYDSAARLTNARLPAARLILLPHVFWRVQHHTTYSRCEFGGKKRMLATNFSKNTKFTVRNARCFANLSIKINLKTLCTVCTNYCNEWTNFYARISIFSQRRIFFSSLDERTKVCNSLWKCFSYTQSLCFTVPFNLVAVIPNCCAANRTHVELTKRKLKKEK